MRGFREGSGREQTRRLAATPTLFGEIRQPKSTYLLIPKVSSMARRYIPIGFVEPSVIASGSALIIPGAALFHFGDLILRDAQRVDALCGRSDEKRLSVSNGIVYNNYPWPPSPTPKQKDVVETAAQKVLDVRANFRARGADLRSAG